MKFFICLVHPSVLTIIALSLSIRITNAQGLQIGDPVLNVELQQVLNYTNSNVRLKDFNKGKALLIDFWFTACASCIESFPKLDSIQKEFKEDLNILLITYESKERTLKTFNTIKRINHIKLPSVVSDTLLHLIFPHTSAPHEIWIDKEGKIKAITDHTSINRKNIRSLIAGEDLNLPVKKDNMEHTLFSPLIKTADLNKMIKYRFISSYQPGLPSSVFMYVDPDNELLKVQAINVQFQSLYILAYNQLDKGFNFNRIIIDKSVLERFKEVNDHSNTYSYEGWWLDTSSTNACQEIQRDLDRLFNLKSYTEKRKVPCIILKEAGIQKRYKSVNPSARTDSYHEKDTLFLENVYLKHPIRNILNYGIYPWSPYQFIDETGYQGQMTIKLPKKFESINHINSFLKEFDLEAIIEERWLNVVVIKDNLKP